MLTYVLLAAALAATPPAPEPPVSRFTNADPPARFQDDGGVTVEFAGQKRIDTVCHPRFGVPPKGMKTKACTAGNRITAPNPCTYPKSDSYARLLCHELAHVNGWPATHGP